MLVCVASSGKNLNSLVSPACQSLYLVIVDVESGKIKNYESFENPVLKVSRAKGQVLANFLESKNIQVFIASNFGRGLHRALIERKIKTLLASGITVEQAAIKAEKGELEEFPPKGWKW